MYLHFRFLHIRNNLLDVVGCAIFAVSIASYPQIGFIIRVKALEVLFYVINEGVNVLVLHLGIEIEILPTVGVALKPELNIS